ncbi:MAG: hypothetical protein JNM56_01340 [Planctomycetia bacterium]|nr:hypothetical protein [Planctomycetia bacterium]
MIELGMVVSTNTPSSNFAAVAFGFPVPMSLSPVIVGTALPPLRCRRHQNRGAFSRTNWLETGVYLQSLS